MNETLKIAQFVADIKFEDLPTDVIERCKIYILDNLTCGFVGSLQPWSKMVTDLVNDLGGKRRRHSGDKLYYCKDQESHYRSDNHW